MSANLPALSWGRVLTKIAFTAFPLGPTNFSAPAGIVVAAALIVSLRNHCRDLNMASSCIDGYKRQVRRSDVVAVVGDVIFYPDFYSYLHRSAEDAIHRRAQNHQIAHVHRHPKVHVINRRSDNVISGVPMRRHGSGEVDPMHESSA